MDDNDIARNDAPKRDAARHPLTTEQAAELFAELGVPRSKRSVQRFCELGHLDFVPIKGPRGDEFFISRLSVERYAEELRQIEAIATIGGEPRHDAPQRDDARNSAPERDTADPARTTTPLKARPVEDESDDRFERDKTRAEILNLRIDNRAKEQAISFLSAQVGVKDQQLQDLSYRSVPPKPVWTSSKKASPRTTRRVKARRRTTTTARLSLSRHMHPKDPFHSRGRSQQATKARRPHRLSSDVCSARQSEPAKIGQGITSKQFCKLALQ
jgi:hypothetical protein